MYPVSRLYAYSSPYTRYENAVMSYIDNMHRPLRAQIHRDLRLYLLSPRLIPYKNVKMSFIDNVRVGECELLEKL